jgi:hypothetical protein
VHVAGDQTPKQLDVGTKTPTGSELYARVKGEPKVFLISGSLDEQLNRTTFDLRDKSILKFDRANVDGLELSPPGAPALTLAKKGSEEWRLTSPVNAQADFSAVDGIINKLSQTQMKAIVESDGRQNLKKYGLDKPQAQATVGAGSARATLAIGAKSPDGTLYARDLTRPMVFTVEATLLDDLGKKVDDIRQKMLFEFRSYTAVGLDITHGTETFSFTKQAGKPQGNQGAGPDVWKQTKPTARDEDLTKMTDFLVDVANLKAASFTDRALTTGDEYVFAVRFGDEKAPKEERVTFRKSGTTVQGIRTGEPGAAVVPTADFDKVVADLKGVTAAK